MPPSLKTDVGLGNLIGVVGFDGMLSVCGINVRIFLRLPHNLVSEQVL